MPAAIKRLRIERFRAFKELTWYPGSELNILLGGGDTGKTTILEAVGLLLNPSNYFPLSNFDYWRRDVDAGFAIEGIFSLSEISAISQQQAMHWPWRWNGNEPFPPPEDPADEPTESEVVYVLRVKGTPELELEYEVLQPDGSTTPLSASLRRSIGLVHLPADGRNDRDLRLVRGSALDRLLADPALRARLELQLADDQLAGHLKEEALGALKTLEDRFKGAALPDNLGLGLTGGPGLSISALVGIIASSEVVKLPLASWGAGTRRLAALTIADAFHGGGPVTIVDELERGLEAYRQRRLVETLRESGRQVFLTTHSPVVLSSASESAGVWYLDRDGKLGSLVGPHLARHRRDDPEAFLSRLTVVCEGITEVGFAEQLLEIHVDGEFRSHGIHLTDSRGHSNSLGILKALTDSGLAFAGLVDNEGTDPGSWAKIKTDLGDLLLQWPSSSLEEEVISRVDDDQLRALIEDPEGEKTGARLRTLADRLGSASKEWDDVAEAGGDSLKRVITEAATGAVPEDSPEVDKARKKELKSHGKHWFKSREGGRELFLKLYTLGIWEKFDPLIQPFASALRNAVGLKSASTAGP